MSDHLCPSEPAAQYQLIETLETVEDHGAAVAYGIRCQEIPAEGANVCHEVHNISTRPDFVKRLVEHLINYEVSPVHLIDIINDYLP
jgi:hypothetical protein